MYLLDHIVHFVDKPEQLVEDTRKIGLHTVEGGKHEIWGTYNSLTYFGVSYIEFIGVFDEELLEKSSQIPHTLHETYKKRNGRNGFTRFAIRTNQIEKDAEKFRAEGLEVNGPEKFSRIRPDGKVIIWKLLHFGSQHNDVDYPFFIQWEESDEQRYNELVNHGTIAAHPLGDLKIKEISYGVDNLNIAKNWASLFNFIIDCETDDYIKLKTPNCFISFNKNIENVENEMFQVTILGASEEKEVKIQGATYKFEKLENKK